MGIFKTSIFLTALIVGFQARAESAAPQLNEILYKKCAGDSGKSAELKLTGFGQFYLTLKLGTVSIQVKCTPLLSKERIYAFDCGSSRLIGDDGLLNELRVQAPGQPDTSMFCDSP